MGDKVDSLVLTTLVRDWRKDMTEGRQMIEDAEVMRRGGQKRLSDADALLVAIKRYNPNFDAEVEAAMPTETPSKPEPLVNSFTQGSLVMNTEVRTYADMAWDLISNMESPTMSEMTAELGKRGWSKGWEKLDYNRFSSAAHGLAEPKTLVKQKVEKFKDPKTGKYRFRALSK